MHPSLEKIASSYLYKLQPDDAPIPHNRLQRMFSKVLRACYPAPHKKHWMEWQDGVWMGTFAGYDEIGRQLGEANVLPVWRATPLPDKWRPFKGPGVRQGHPFNVDAMREVTQCWKPLLHDTRALQAMHRRLYRLEDQTLAARDMLIITTVAVSIPAFLLRRGDNPIPDGQIPRLAAAAFKVLGGMYNATSQMFSQAHPMLMQPTLDFAEFLDYLEKHRILMADENRACAGPVKMIREIVEVTLGFEDKPESPMTDGLAYLGQDAERAFTYGVLCLRAELITTLYLRGLHHYLHPLLQSNTSINAAAQTCIAETIAYWRMEETRPMANYIAMAQHILELFGDTDPEHTFLTALPNTTDQSLTDITQIGAACMQLEHAMRQFISQHQLHLDHILQRTAKSFSQQDWSPTLGAGLLRKLQKLEPKLFG